MVMFADYIMVCSERRWMSLNSWGQLPKATDSAQERGRREQAGWSG